jgi:cell division protease FtsH
MKGSCFLKKYGKNLSMYAMIIMFILVGVSLSNVISPIQTQEPYTYSQLINQIRNQEIQSIEIIVQAETSNFGRARVQQRQPEPTGTDQANVIDALAPQTTLQTVQILDIATFMSIIDEEILLGNEVIVTTTIARRSFLISLIPIMITIMIAIFLLTFMVQQMQGGGGAGRAMSFGKTKAKLYVDDNNNLKFDQVAGLDEEKAELEEVVEFLKEPKKFVDLGAKIPKGVLLVGPPGTGKTYLAKAVAGEAGVPFFSISGSDFVEMFVGVGASRVRDLFEQAKKNLPCIVFIDEIDAVGRKRGSGHGGGHDEREQTLNQLLVEMDGFGVNEGVIIIAATNRHDVLDPALLRPGRFDRLVMVNTPDVKGREAVLKIHTQGKSVGKDVDLKVIAQTTSGFTPADLANLLNESALLSARFNKKEIGMEEVRKAFIKITVGTEKHSHVISERERRITAYHEAGHAILNELLEDVDPTYMVSIIPTGRAGGYTMNLPGEDKSYNTKKFMKENIITLLGGRVAEELVIKDITTGASNDIERATAIARNMVTKYGMSEKLGPIRFNSSSDGLYQGQGINMKEYGESISKTIDEEVEFIIKEAYSKATSLIEEYIHILHEIARILLENEKVTGAEIRKLFPEGAVKGFVKEAFMTNEQEETDETTEQSETADETIEQSETADKATEQSETADKATEQSETADKATEQSETKEEATEQNETTDKATEESETTDKTTEQNENNK